MDTCSTIKTSALVMLLIPTIGYGLCSPAADNHQVKSGCPIFRAATTNLPATITALRPFDFMAAVDASKQAHQIQMGQLLNRLQIMRKNGGAFSPPLKGVEAEQTAEQFSPWGALGLATEATMHGRNTTDVSAYEQKFQQLLGGVDYRFNDNLVAGIAYGKSRSDIHFAASTDNIQHKKSHEIAYASWHRNFFYVDIITGTSKGKLLSYRNNPLGNPTTASSTQTQSNQHFALVSANFDFHQKNLSYGTLAGLGYLHGELLPIVEKQINNTQLSISEQQIISLVFNMGARIQYAWQQSWGALIPHAKVQWKREIKDAAVELSGQLTNTGSNQAFELRAGKPERNWLEFNTGISAALNHGFSAYANYQWLFGFRPSSVNSYSLGLRWDFSY